MDPKSDRPYFEPSEEADDAVQVGEATPLAAREQAGGREAVGAGVEGDAGGYFGVKTEAEANEALVYFANYCKNCQWEERCPGDNVT